MSRVNLINMGLEPINSVDALDCELGEITKKYISQIEYYNTKIGKARYRAKQSGLPDYLVKSCVDHALGKIDIAFNGKKKKDND